MRRPWVVLVAGIAPLAGCGGGDGHEGRAVTLPAGRTLSVKADEYSFDPDRVTVRKPGELRITLRNEGSLAHDLRVFRGEREVGGTPAFEKGERSARVRLTTGRYRFVCTIGDHAKLGMDGTLTVR
jgi:plastocyanin